MTALVRCDRVSRTYGQGSRATIALAPATCEITAGDRIAIVGPSGSGKSTLLHLLAGLDTPTSGEVVWPAFDRLRPGTVAVVFQGPSLLPALTVHENVAVALLLAGATAPAASQRAREALGELSLDELADKLPEE